ncbi:MAG: bacteriocin fulvocin C-related protein, partial [Bacteroidota bacterium]|nr:bacteriocin fulvocin C-related protein [Bacteroidota bacterium]
MKQIFCIVLFSVVLFSCQQTELEYSCDPVINKFVLENKVEFSQISVTELTTYEVALQKAVFRSWDPEKKRNAWLDKLHQVLCSIPLTKPESDHIQKLIEHLEVGYFLDENIQKNDKYRAKFAYEWLNYANKYLGWSEQFIAFMVYRLYANQSRFD